MTQRQLEVIEAALSYAFSNRDDLNDAMLAVQGRRISELTEQDFDDTMEVIGRIRRTNERILAIIQRQ